MVTTRRPRFQAREVGYGMPDFLPDTRSIFCILPDDFISLFIKGISRWHLLIVQRYVASY